MMQIRKGIASILALSLIFIFTACGEPTIEQVPVPSKTTVPPNAQQTSTPSTSLAPIVDRLEGTALNEFDLDISLDTEKHQLTIQQSLTYHNHAKAALSEIYFNLVGDAFEKQGGGVEIQSAAADNAPVKLQKKEGTVYEMSLPTPLEPEETMEIGLKYTVDIPNIQNRFGYQEDVYNVGNFIITPAVYDADGWAIRPYVDLGDAFYTDIANYTVNIHVPEGYQVAATGTKGEDGAFHAQKVRDFAFCASSQFNVLTADVDGTHIMVYFDDNMAQTADSVLETTQKSLALFSRLFGEYPYETMTVVLSGMTNNVSGMEYPTLIMVGPEITIEDLEQEGFATEAEKNGYKAMIDRAVVHEVAHQWFYGVVGNDQVNAPWLDEGMCRFAEYLYEKAYPLEEPLADFCMPAAEILASEHEYLSEGQGLVDVDLNQSLYDWEEKDPMGYSGIYSKGASLLYQMEKQMGEEEFQRALRAYVDEFAYEFVTPESFRQFWNEQEDFTGLFDLYFS